MSDHANTGKAQVSYRLPRELIRLVEKAAMEAGLARQEGGRAYNPSAVVERILRAHFTTKAQRGKKAPRRAR